MTFYGNNGIFYGGSLPREPMKLDARSAYPEALSATQSPEPAGSWTRISPDARRATENRSEPARNAWTREQESRKCRYRYCKAEPGQPCLTKSGARACRPHVSRFREAVRATKIAVNSRYGKERQQ